MCVVVIVGMDTRFSNSHCRKQYASQWKVCPPPPLFSMRGDWWTDAFITHLPTIPALIRYPDCLYRA